jgi:integrase
MTTLYPRGQRWYIGVPRRRGGWAKRATGTRDKYTARAMARMIDELGPAGRRDWELLDAVDSGQISVAELFDAWRANDVEGLRARLRDVDLEPHVARWVKVLKGAAAADTVDHYELYVRSLIPEGVRFPRSELSYRRLTDWLSSRAVGRSTKRKYHAALSQFCNYLRGVGMLDANPMRDVKAPPAAPPRMEYQETAAKMRAIAAAQPEPFRTLSLLMHATGIEVSVALALRKQDIDGTRREIRARGTKTATRDRLAKVAAWAWPDIERFIKLLHPAAPLFPRISRYTASDQHRAACASLGLTNYQLRDTRHSYAVRAIRAGASFEVVSQQLGHANTTMVVSVYGRFRPSEQERSDWERVAEVQDAERAKNEAS